jgi:Rieske Fe-S protein
MRRSASLPFVALVSASLALAACNSGPKDTSVSPEPKTTAPATPAPAPAPAPTANEGALRLGSPIEASVEKVALTDVAKNPNAFVGKKFATTGTVTAVCQHMGCWMEIKDDSGEAHIKMAGHSFFVPKTASGRKARVLATLVKNEEEGACAEENHDKMAAAGGAANAPAAKAGAGAGAAKKGCRAEAEAQLGRPLAKLELVADGVELM